MVHPNNSPGGGLEVSNGELLIDGTGLHLLPGQLTHTSTSENREYRQGRFAKWSRAAVAGGDCFFGYAKQCPNATNRHFRGKLLLLNQKREITSDSLLEQKEIMSEIYKISKAWTEFAESRYSWEVAQGTYLFMNKRLGKYFCKYWWYNRNPRRR
ncbi:MAG: hypothetical protein Ct9H90mP14_1450 [Methanobacteriota archaeon]|nr:MAG: hypothetical protein Ct9H90mP14_1450 [Euryarchaeota archaeon]